MTADVEQSGELADQLCRQFAKVAPALELQGIEQLVMSFGWILASDGSFGPDKAGLVSAVGQAAGLTAAHVQGVLSTIEQSAQRPS